MSISLKRKLYARGGSFETTIPLQLLFSLDTEKKQNVIFEFDKNTGRWYINFEEEKSKKRFRNSINK